MFSRIEAVGFRRRDHAETGGAAMSDPAEDTSGPLRLSISEQAYQHLRSKIIAREIEPGTVIGERRLADDLQASRTPLRAAISRLEGEGLVERLTNGSIVIRQLSVDELLDILFVRRILEGDAAFLAAQRKDLTVLARPTTTEQPPV